MRQIIRSLQLSYRTRAKSRASGVVEEPPPPPPPSPDKGLIAIGRDFSRLCWAEPGVVSIQIPLQTVSQEGSKVGREKILYRKWVLEQGEQTNRRTDEEWAFAAGIFVCLA